MSVIVIGDRAVGKTHMALALAKKNEGLRVKIVDPSYEALREELQNADTGEMVPTREIIERPVKLEVDLSHTHRIKSLWVDTPGEWWETEWQRDHYTAWNDFKQKIGQNIGIILLLPPYQKIVSNNLLNQASPDMTLDRDKLMNAQRWCNNLENWLKFLNQNCSRVDNIAICLHKADLFCESLDDEARRTEGNPVDRQTQVRNGYFAVAKEVINRNNREVRPFQFFVTSISHRTLLEAPWLYLSPYILYHR
jgi:GTPase SAR1 family protein